MVLANRIFLVMNTESTLKDVIVSIDYSKPKTLPNVQMTILHDDKIEVDGTSIHSSLKINVLAVFNEIFQKSSLRKNFHANVDIKYAAFLDYNNSKLRRFNIIAMAMILLSFSPLTETITLSELNECFGISISNFHLILLHYLVLNKCCNGTNSKIFK